MKNVIAFLAFMLRTVGLALALPLFTFLAVNLPVIAELYQQGSQEMIAVIEANFTGLGLVLLGVAGGASIIGFLLFVIAMWRDGRLPRWTIVLFALSLPLLTLAVSLTTEFLGAVLLLISASVMAWKGWQESVPTVSM